MIEKLEQLVKNGMLSSFEFKKQIPSLKDNNISKLIDELTLVFTNGEKIEISTGCSGCLENTTLYIK